MSFKMYFRRSSQETISSTNLFSCHLLCARVHRLNKTVERICAKLVLTKMIFL